ncbi:hypothetical protein SLA2020_074460 [Shorea laevis]
MSTTSPTTTTPSAEWMQFYEQSAAFDEMGAASFSDATMVTTNLTSDGNLSPGSSSPVKSTRRRSRASKKAPTTLLNANAGNFRALVQQFTGCPSRDLSRRGAINLNFAQGNDASAQSQSNVSASTMATFGTNYYFQQPGQPQPWPPQQQHQMFQNQQNDVHIDDVSTQGFRAEPYPNEHKNDGYFF